jgi:hypothetical protein
MISEAEKKVVKNLAAYDFMTESHNQCQNPMISPHGYKSTEIKRDKAMQ